MIYENKEGFKVRRIWEYYWGNTKLFKSNPPPPYVIKNKNPKENIAEMEKLEAELIESFEKLPPDAKEYYREYTEMIKEYIKGMTEYMEEIMACRDILEQYDNSSN